MKIVPLLTLLLTIVPGVVFGQALPPVRFDTNARSTDLAPPEQHPSPDGKQLLASYKYATGISVAVLYKHGDKGAWTPVTVRGQRFDEAAWRWWAGAKGGQVPALGTGPRLCRFKNWSPDGRYVDVQLLGHRGAPVPVRFDTKTATFASAK